MSVAFAKKLTLPDGGPKARESKLEADFAFLWATLGKGLPAPVREHKFHESRKWRFDFAWVREKVAVELEGLLPGFGGRHQRVKGLEGDLEKYNEATILGWRILRFSGGMLKRDPHSALQQVKGLLTE